MNPTLDVLFRVGDRGDHGFGLGVIEAGCMEHSFCMGAEEAIEYGIVPRVIETHLESG